MSDLTAIRGDTESYTITVTDAAGTPVNLTGCNLWFTAKIDKRDTDTLAVITKQTGDGITHTNAAGGIATLDLTPSDTNKLPLDVTLYYDVQLKLGSGSIITVNSGTISVTGDVTRAIA